MTDMECKSCGSTKFKRIQYKLFECEYCGREYEVAGVHRVDNPKYVPSPIGSIIYDPTKSLFLSPFYYDKESLQLNIQVNMIKEKFEELEKPLQ